MEIFENIIQIIVNYILIPALLSVVPVILMKLEAYIKALIISTTDKVETESNAAYNQIIVNVLSQLEIIVSSAVSANMVFSEKFKESSEDGKLTPEEIIELQQMARSLIYDTLPITFKTGNVLKIIGGQDALDKLISSMIEKVLIEIKSKK